jgi:hypothetical protein
MGADMYQSIYQKTWLSTGWANLLLPALTVDTWRDQKGPAE